MSDAYRRNSHDQFYFKTAEEMGRIEEFPKALERTAAIAERATSRSEAIEKLFFRTFRVPEGPRGHYLSPSPARIVLAARPSRRETKEGMLRQDVADRI